MTLIHTNMQIFPHCVDSGFSSCLIYGLGFQSGASIGGRGGGVCVKFYTVHECVIDSF